MRGDDTLLRHNVNNGLVIVPRWQFFMLRMHRFLRLLPALAAACVLVLTGWKVMRAVIEWNVLAIFIWLWCGTAALAYARRYIGLPHLFR